MHFQIKYQKRDVKRNSEYYLNSSTIALFNNSSDIDFEQCTLLILLKIPVIISHYTLYWASEHCHYQIIYSFHRTMI